MNTTWRKSITHQMTAWDEDWSDVEACTLSEEELDTVFDCGYGCIEGKPFTVWTKNRVYFPEGYDGAEQATSVARHPDNEPTSHVGGGC